MAAFDLVVFDLGGVLADFGGVDAMRELAGIESADELWRRWLSCRWVRTFEAGRCSPDEFAAGVVEDWALGVAPQEFLAAFRSWLVDPFPGAEELVSAVRSVGPVACLSNTNRLHWEDAVARWRLLELFDHRFLSFEVGHVKPDAEIFERVGTVTGLSLDRVLFLDDNEINVEGARAVGMAAVRARGVDGARAALVSAGVLG